MLARCFALFLFLAAGATAALVRVEQLEVSDVLNGKSFGSAGPYQRIIAKAWFAVDPKLPVNRMIADIDLAPREADGRVLFSTDLYILQPRDAKRGNGAVLFELPNRGVKPLLHFYNLASNSLDPRKPAEFGDGFLLEAGYTVVWLGWQFDVPAQTGLLRLYVPVAKSVKGLVRSEYIADKRENSFSVADRGHIPYHVEKALELTVRDTVTGPRVRIPEEKWKIEDGNRVVVPDGLQAGKIYELIYEATGSPIAGLGSAAVRDFSSFLKYGGLQSPVLQDRSLFLRRVYAFGASQSGRFLRQFVYEGFNEDEGHRRVFDAMLIHIAGAGRGSFNQRFAQPSRDFHAFLNTLYPVDLFPFTDFPETDAETGMTGSLLARAEAAKVVPKIFYTNGSYEYWSRTAALIHVTPDGLKDAPITSTTRIYYFAGAQHSPAGFPPQRNAGQNLPNPNPYTLGLRALLVAMDCWVRDGTPPPPSRYPLLRDGSLVHRESLRFPTIPGVTWPTRPHLAYRGDFDAVPPRPGEPFPFLAPQVDADGNETAGIRMPEQQVPLATFTGWNLRSPEIGAPQEMLGSGGSWIPFPPEKISARYAGRDQYVKKLEAAAEDLVRQGYLLNRDKPRAVKHGMDEWDYLHR